MMTKPFLQALAGEAIWPPPIWLMRQAGRYLPEYRAVRAKAGDFIALCTNPELAAEVTLQPIRRYGFDAAILFSDILLIPWALGHGLRFAEGEGPLLPPLREVAALDALKPEEMLGKLAPVLETVRRVRAGLDDQRALIGFAGAPFTVACYMVEGGGSRDFNATRRMAYAEPALFARLMDVLTQATVDFLSAQIEAGADTAMLFDSWAGILSPSQFRAHVIAPAQTISAALRQRFPHIRLIGFPRLAGTMLGEYATATGLDAIGIDTAVNPGLAASMVPASTALQGNLDPMALLAGGAALRAEARAILDVMKGRPFVFNLGHGIVPQTPPEHVAELLAIVRAG
jgi:uroporphyrinogen decarboxylase